MRPSDWEHARRVVTSERSNQGAVMTGSKLSPDFSRGSDRRAIKGDLGNHRAEDHHVAGCQSVLPSLEGHGMQGWRVEGGWM